MEPRAGLGALLREHRAQQGGQLEEVLRLRLTEEMDQIRPDLRERSCATIFVVVGRGLVLLLEHTPAAPSRRCTLR